MRDEIGVYEFIISLAIALETDEQEFFRQYVLAHGDPKKFKWVYRDRPGDSVSGVNVDALAAGMAGDGRSHSAGKTAKGDVADFAHMSNVLRVDKRTLTYPDGRIVVEYVDRDGNEVDVGGMTFMRSPRLEAERAGT